MPHSAKVTTCSSTRHPPKGRKDGDHPLNSDGSFMSCGDEEISAMLKIVLKFRCYNEILGIGSEDEKGERKSAVRIW